MYVFRKICRSLFSWNTRFEIRLFDLLPTIYSFLPFFFSFWVACKRHKSTIRICTECRYYALVGAPYCYLDMFDRLQRLLCRTLGPTFAASLISLTCRCSKSFCKHYFGRWLNWLLSHNLVWVLPVILTSHTFSVNIPRFQWMSMSTISFFVQ